MTCASVNRSRLPDDLRMNTIRHSVSKSRAFSKLDLSRRPPLARARTLPNSRVHRVAIRLDSLQSVVRSTRAWAFSAAMTHPPRRSLTDLVRDVGQAELAQVMALAGAHGGGAGLVVVVIAAQVQQAVDDVQGQLRLDVVAP